MTQKKESNSEHPDHIILTSHPGKYGPKPIPIIWGAESPEKRGPVLGSTSSSSQRNVIGTYSGSYSIYRALAIASGQLKPNYKADLTNTAPAEDVGPFPSWKSPNKIISLDPYGHIVTKVFKTYLDQGIDIRPTIAITKAHINVPEINTMLEHGEMTADEHVINTKGEIVVTKAAIDPVWHLPGIAERFKCKESDLRRILFEKTAGMFPELITRPDLKVFLPPIGGLTLYIFGDLKGISDPSKQLTIRVHDECNGSDVFGSDICTCRPYLVHGIELCVETAQKGGSGVIVYNRKEGRGLGEVTKFLVYNARKRQDGGDSAAKYFERTECVAGVQDVRFQELMPDVLHWLGISKIDRFVSMSNHKFDAVISSGIDIKERVSLPEEKIPKDAAVEMEAKKAAGYFTHEKPLDHQQLEQVKGRKLNE